MTETTLKSGFVTIIGAPNVGKSTLLNHILGQKVAITSPRPQTTRHRILGVYNAPGLQAIFTDTPGVIEARGALNTSLVATALTALEDADLVCYMVEPSPARSAGDRIIAEELARLSTPVILAINKVDRVAKERLLPLIEGFHQAMPLAAITPICALSGDNVPALLDEVRRNLPEGPAYYPEETFTDQPERLIAAEMVREQVFMMTRNEIPYSTAVTVELFDETDPELIRIHAAIHLERDSQKGIVIGNKGVMLKQIGTAARQEIERMLGVKVFLKLFVRVEKNWTKDPRALSRFGY